MGLLTSKVNHRFGEMGTNGYVSGAPTRTQAAVRVDSSHFGSGMAEEW